MARVGRDAFVRSRDQDLGAIVADGLAWIRRVRTEGAEGRVLPVPSVPGLWPNMTAEGAFPWHHAKTQIAAQLGDLTILPRGHTELRAAPPPRGGRRGGGFWAPGAGGLRGPGARPRRRPSKGRTRPPGRAFRTATGLRSSGTTS